MSEILTESFCERCGTRYTFESPPRRSSPLEALGTVGRGLRKFVASPDQSIDEAFAVARAETEQRTTAHQLEAFHRTFNFCLSCRQYTCGECWNPIEGRCQSCAPMAELEAPPEVIGLTPETLTAAESVADAPVVLEAIAIARAASSPVLEAPEAPEGADEVLEVEAEPEPDATIEADARAEALVALEPEPAFESEPEPALDVAPEPEPMAPAPPAGSLPAFPPGVSLDEEIAAYDLRVAALAVPPPPPPAIEPIAAVSAPISSAPTPAPVPRIVAAVVPDLPAASEAAMPAAQAATSCPSCGLALSATARFCRRCGTAQAH